MLTMVGQAQVWDQHLRLRESNLPGPVKMEGWRNGGMEGRRDLNSGLSREVRTPPRVGADSSVAGRASLPRLAIVDGC
jgi:hypothetical protein